MCLGEGEDFEKWWNTKVGGIKNDGRGKTCNEL